MSEYAAALHRRLHEADHQLKAAVGDGDEYTVFSYAAEMADLLEAARRNGTRVPCPRDWNGELDVVSARLR
jgi:hypothetical protein